MNELDAYAPTQTFDNFEDNPSYQPWASLIFTRNYPSDSNPKEYKLYPGLTHIGRDRNSTVPIRCKTVAKSHATIDISSQVFTISDNDSRNRTRKGRMKLEPFVRYELKNGDEITFGNVKCVFRVLREITYDSEDDGDNSMIESDSDSDDPNCKVNECVKGEDAANSEVIRDDNPETCVIEDYRDKEIENILVKHAAPMDTDLEHSNSDSDDEFLKATQVPESALEIGLPKNLSDDEYPKVMMEEKMNEEKNFGSANCSNDEFLLATQDYYSSAKLLSENVSTSPKPSNVNGPKKPTTSASKSKETTGTIIARTSDSEDDDDDDEFLNLTQNFSSTVPNIENLKKVTLNNERNGEINTRLSNEEEIATQAYSELTELNDTSKTECTNNVVEDGNTSSDLFTQQYDEFDSIPDSFFFSTNSKKVKNDDSTSDLRTQVLSPSPVEITDKRVQSHSTIATQFVRSSPTDDTSDNLMSPSLETQVFEGSVNRKFGNDETETQNYNSFESKRKDKPLNNHDSSFVLETQDYLSSPVSSLSRRGNCSDIPTQNFFEGSNDSLDTSSTSTDVETQVLSFPKSEVKKRVHMETQMHFPEFPPQECKTPVGKFAVPAIPKRSLSKKRPQINSPDDTFLSNIVAGKSLEKKPKLNSESHGDSKFNDNNANICTQFFLDEPERMEVDKDTLQTQIFHDFEVHGIMKSNKECSLSDESEETHSAATQFYPNIKNVCVSHSSFEQDNEYYNATQDYGSVFKKLDEQTDVTAKKSFENHTDLETQIIDPKIIMPVSQDLSEDQATQPYLPYISHDNSTDTDLVNNLDQDDEHLDATQDYNSTEYQSGELIQNLAKDIVVTDRKNGTHKTDSQVKVLKSEAVEVVDQATQLYLQEIQHKVTINKPHKNVSKEHDQETQDYSIEKMSIKNNFSNVTKAAVEDELQGSTQPYFSKRSNEEVEQGDSALLLSNAAVDRTNVSTKSTAEKPETLSQSSSIHQSNSKEFLSDPIEDSKPRQERKGKTRGNTRSKESQVTCEKKKEEPKVECNPEGKKVMTTDDNPSRSRRASRQSIFRANAFNVIFTGAVDIEAQKIVADLKGTVVDSCLSPRVAASEATVAVMDKSSIRRTLKYLCIVAMGKPVLDFQWIFDSKAANHFIEYKKYFVSSEVSKMHEKGGRVLEGLKIHVTPRVVPSPEQMKDVVVCGGGIFMEEMPVDSSKDCIIISCKEDANLIPKNNSCAVLDKEFILTGIVTGNLNYSKYSLKVNRSRKRN